MFSFLTTKCFRLNNDDTDETKCFYQPNLYKRRQYYDLDKTSLARSIKQKRCYIKCFAKYENK